KRRSAAQRLLGGSDGESAAEIAQPRRVRRLRQGYSRSRRRLRCGPVAPGNSHPEFAKPTNPAIDLDCAAVLLRHNVVADRKTETCAFAGRLGRKERLE